MCNTCPPPMAKPFTIAITVFWNGCGLTVTRVKYVKTRNIVIAYINPPLPRTRWSPARSRMLFVFTLAVVSTSQDNNADFCIVATIVNASISSITVLGRNALRTSGRLIVILQYHYRFRKLHLHNYDPILSNQICSWMLPFLM